MSNCRYYEDAYTTQFQAKIIEKISDDNRYGIVLDSTYFYPESGGQPADLGTINGRSVTHVSIREADEAIVHWLDGDVGAEDRITAVIDWPRRFDHMQQHTGQHILSQAFIQIAEAETVGFHLNETNLTIDIDRADMTDSEIGAVERLANQAVWDNHPVTVRFVAQDEIAKLNLRKVPPVRNGRLRLIDIQNFDLTACGGTHVSHTGSVGLIKIIKQEKRGEKTRIEFCCGNRALQDYTQKHTIVNDLTAELTTGATELLQSIIKMRQENKDAQRTIKKQHEALVASRAQQFIVNGTKIRELTLVKKLFEENDATDFRTLATHLTKEANIVVLFGQAGKRTQLLFARSAQLTGDMNQLLKAALAQLGDGGGGGSAAMAQGGGPAHTRQEVMNALETAQSVLVDWLSP